jgi:Fic family protein
MVWRWDYRLLGVVREEGDWEAWLAVFLEGVASTADGAVATAQHLVQMFERDQQRVRAEGGRRTASLLRVYEAMKARPVQSVRTLAERTELTFPTVAAALGALAAEPLGIVREVTGGRRNRVFVYEQLLGVLNEGTENL